MPLDQQGFVIETKPDLSKPSLEGLAWLLRHQAEWERSHKWDFTEPLERNECGTVGCAVGLAAVSWPKHFDKYLETYTIDFAPPEIFNIPKPISDRIFGMGDSVEGIARHYRKKMALVTPLDVADAIDRYLASRS